MNWWHRLFQKKELEHRLDAELRFHFESQVADNIRAGMTPEEARRQARLNFGGVESIKEDCRDARGTLFIDSTIQDVRFSIRTLRKSPAFTIAAIWTLALGIGANTAIFQLLDAVRLRSLPIPNPQQLVRLQIRGGNRGFGVTHDDLMLTTPIWEQIRDHNQAFSNVFAWVNESFAIGEGPQAREVLGLVVSGEFFNALQIPPAAGRLFGQEDDPPTCSAPGVVLSYAFWQSNFGGQPSAIGQDIKIDGRPFHVVGVTPPSFTGLDVGTTFSVAAPMCAFKPSKPRADLFWLVVMGRLKSGLSVAQASDQMSAISPALFEQTVPSGYSTESLARYKEFRLEAIPAGNGVSALRKQYDKSLWLLLAITGLVLLIACANLANLLLARAGARQKEFAVRLALGASRARLVRQSLVESLLLSFTGAFLGLALARVLSQAIVFFLGSGVQLDLGTDWRMLAFTASVAVAACLVFGLLPAVRSSRSDPGTTIKAGGRGLTTGPERFSIQRFLVVTQIAVSLMLVVGALLFVRSFRNLMSFDPGFREKGIVLGYFDMRNLHLTPTAIKPFKNQLLEAVRSAPQVENAATTTNFLLVGGTWGHGIRTTNKRAGSNFTWVSPGHFSTLDIPLLSGRDFNANDTDTSPHVAIVSQGFALKFWGSANPIGQTFRTVAEPNYPETLFEIIGLIKDTAYSDIRATARPIAYAPASQFPGNGPFVDMYIRSAASTSTVMTAVRERVRQLNPEIAVNFDVMQTRIESGFKRERLMAALSGFFGALAALLAAIGLYGLIAFLIVRRRNEIGIRIALGATRSQVVGLVMKEASVLVFIGVAVGIAGSLALSRTAASLLFGLNAHDPVTLLAAGGLLAAVAAIGSFLPARRASKLDPMNALRNE